MGVFQTEIKKLLRDLDPEQVKSEHAIQHALNVR